MHKLGLGVVIALTLAALAYAATLAFQHDHPRSVAQAVVKRSPQEIAARERMARLVAEVAARSAAHTAKQVATRRLQQPGISSIQASASTETVSDPSSAFVAAAPADDQALGLSADEVRRIAEEVSRKTATKVVSSVVDNKQQGTTVASTR